jgi:hypothetical protein
MKLSFRELTKDKQGIDLTRLCSSWSWLLEGQEDVAFISLAGDLFFVGQNDEINWLNTGLGDLVTVADDMKHFELLCLEEKNLEYWFLASVVEDILKTGVELKDNEVFGYHLMPILGGDYTADNLGPVDIYTHFQITGLICQETKDLPEGTTVESRVLEKGVREQAIGEEAPKEEAPDEETDGNH